MDFIFLKTLKTRGDPVKVLVSILLLFLYHSLYRDNHVNHRSPLTYFSLVDRVNMLIIAQGIRSFFSVHANNTGENIYQYNSTNNHNTKLIKQK